MSDHLIFDRISDAASRAYGKEPRTAREMCEFYKLWIASAKRIKADFEGEGLNNSAKYVETKIAFVQDLLSRESVKVSGTLRLRMGSHKR